MNEEWTDVGDNATLQQLAIRHYCRHFVSMAGSYVFLDANGEPTGQLSWLIRSRRATSVIPFTFRTALMMRVR